MTREETSPRKEQSIPQKKKYSAVQRVLLQLFTLEPAATPTTLPDDIVVTRNSLTTTSTPSQPRNGMLLLL